MNMSIRRSELWTLYWFILQT